MGQSAWGVGHRAWRHRAGGKEKDRSPKLKAQSSKSKDVIDFIGVDMSIGRANSTDCITQRAKCNEHRVERFYANKNLKNDGAQRLHNFSHFSSF